MASRRRNRRAEQGEAHNHERWVLSYADFVTLLFAFFVVMYAISSVNEGKYKTLSESLSNAFSNNENLGVIPQPIEVGSVPMVIQPIQLQNISTSPIRSDNPPQLSEEIQKERKLLAEISDQFEAVLQPFIEDDLVNIKKYDYWVELEMNSELLFLSGEAELSKKAIPVLERVVAVIKNLPNPVNVEGHTDNLPIDTVKFPSNWSLSSARAASVVQEFIRGGIDPVRLSAVGYGEFHPLADNKDEAGRFKNRRVSVVFMSQAFARYGASDADRAKLLNIISGSVPQNALP
ncbi:MAG: flagellar motor protein MotB [Methylobacter sp.]|nr:MAG: flagellar motor protein MotB [Methylobacter sp.]